MKTVMTLCDEDASAAIAAVRAELIKRGKTGTVAVTDAHGELIALLRMTGTALNSMTVATNKAFTAARLKRASADLGRAVRHADNGYDVAYFGDGRYVGFAGGQPVVKDGQVLGAVGVSGLTQAEDDELALLGVAAILAR
jgi:glc operon protein GlcG